VVSAFLVLQIGEKPARDLLLTGRIFTSEEAARLGLVNEVVEAEKLTARTLELVAMLRANSPEAMAATKRLLRAQNKAWLDSAIAAALAANAEARGTHDFREGVAAFLEKRKPVWSRG
jgi:methylglutaconyl-CoA hydratase